jgi:hypothetical protein
MLLESIYTSQLRAWKDAGITELLNIRTKSILVCDLNAKHPVWNSKVSNPSDLKLLDLFVYCNFEISAPKYPTHFVPNGRGDVLDIVVHKDIRLSEVRVLDFMDSDHLPIMFCILDRIKARCQQWECRLVAGSELLPLLRLGGLENWNWEFRSCKRTVVEERECELKMYKGSTTEYENKNGTCPSDLWSG